jgi:hypothetical protein
MCAVVKHPWLWPAACGGGRREGGMTAARRAAPAPPWGGRAAGRPARRPVRRGRPCLAAGGGGWAGRPPRAPPLRVDRPPARLTFCGGKRPRRATRGAHSGGGLALGHAAQTGHQGGGAARGAGPGPALGCAAPPRSGARRLLAPRTPRPRRCRRRAHAPHPTKRALVPLGPPHAFPPSIQPRPARPATLPTLPPAPRALPRRPPARCPPDLTETGPPAS